MVLLHCTYAIVIRSLSRCLVLIAVLALAVGVQGERDTFKVEFDIQLSAKTTGTVVSEVHPSWASIGAARFNELVTEGDTFWKGIRFFRVIEGFMTQFGVPVKLL